MEPRAAFRPDEGNVIRLPVDNLHAQIADLCAQLDQVTRERDAALAALNPQPGQKKYPWLTFSNLGIRKFGKTRGCQRAFLDHFPQYNPGHITKWRLSNEVPGVAYDLLLALDVDIAVSSAYQAWTDTEYDFLRLLLIEHAGQKTKGREMARLLSEKFGRKITEGAFKGAKNRVSR